jgi:hypothetical protein
MSPYNVVRFDPQWPNPSGDIAQSGGSPTHRPGRHFSPFTASATVIISASCRTFGLCRATFVPDQNANYFSQLYRIE